MAGCYPSRAFCSTCLLLCLMLPTHQNMVGDGQQHLLRHDAQSVALGGLQGCWQVLCIAAQQPAQNEPGVKVVAR